MSSKPDPVDPKQAKAVKGGSKRPAKPSAEVADQTPAEQLPRPRRPGRPKGQTTGERPVSTKGRVRSERPGAQVETDRNGKTYEGKTGISGETADDGDDK